MEQLILNLKDDSDESLRLVKEQLEECCFIKKRVEITLDCSFVPTSIFMYKIFTLFFDYQIAYLKKVFYLKENQMEVLEITLRNGEQLEINNPTIIIGDIHKEAVLHVHNLLFISGNVEGTIYLYKSKGAIFGENFISAKLVFENDVIKILDGKKLYFDNLKGGNILWRVLSL